MCCDSETKTDNVLRNFHSTEKHMIIHSGNKLDDLKKRTRHIAIILRVSFEQNLAQHGLECWYACSQFKENVVALQQGANRFEKHVDRQQCTMGSLVAVPRKRRPISFATCPKILRQPNATLSK